MTYVMMFFETLELCRVLTNFEKNCIVVVMSYKFLFDILYLAC